MSGIAQRRSVQIILALIVLGLGLRLHYLPVANRTPDESTYVAYAQAVRDGGPGAIASSTRQYVDQPQAHVLPPPTRFGLTGVGALAMFVTGRSGPQPLAWASTIASLALMVLVAYFGFRFLDPWVTAAALTFLVASPLDLAISRRAWGDELLSLTAFGILVGTVMQRASPAKHTGQFLALSLGAFSIWQKETGALLLGIAVLFVVMAPRVPTPARVRLAAAAALAVVGAAVVQVVASGGIATTVDALQAVTSAVATNSYAQEYQTGGPLYYVRGFAALHPIPIVLGCGMAIATLTGLTRMNNARGYEHRQFAMAVLSWFALILLAVGLAYPQKNLRFVAAAYAPLYLLAGAAVRAITAYLASLRLASPRVVYGAMTAMLLVAVANDHRVFRHYFEERDVPDLATPWFTN